MSAAPTASPQPPLRVAVRAAGGLVLRAGADSEPRVLLVHRRVQRDWGFPKGGRRSGETLLAAALREVREETGLFCLAESLLGDTEYVDRWERTKVVRYWAMRRVSGAFAANDEVDECAWLRPAEAIVRLTHDRDRRFLDVARAEVGAVLARRRLLREESLG